MFLYNDILGLSGMCAGPCCSGVLPEASSQPLADTVPQRTAVPQRLRAGLLRTGPQHPAALRYVRTHRRHTDWTSVSTLSLTHASYISYTGVNMITQTHTHAGICEVRRVNRESSSG